MPRWWPPSPDLNGRTIRVARQNDPGQRIIVIIAAAIAATIYRRHNSKIQRAADVSIYQPLLVAGLALFVPVLGGVAGTALARSCGSFMCRWWAGGSGHRSVGRTTDVSDGSIPLIKSAMRRTVLIIGAFAGLLLAAPVVER